MTPLNSRAIAGPDPGQRHDAARSSGEGQTQRDQGDETTLEDHAESVTVAPALESPPLIQVPPSARSSPFPVYLPAGPELHALARRRAVRDAGFWIIAVAGMACNIGFFWNFRGLITEVTQDPFSWSTVFAVVVLPWAPFIVYWFLKLRIDAIAAKLHRSLPITTCRNCLYNAVGVPTDRCPECGERSALNPPRANP